MASGRKVLASEWITQLLFSKNTTPRFGLDFPARRLTTKMVWNDFVLPVTTKSQVSDMIQWVRYNYLLMEDKNLERKVQPGLRVLFKGTRERVKL
jgi:hypothetical protein